MKRILLPLASLFLLSFTLIGQNCALSISVTISDCNPDGTVTLGITISDPSDNAQDVDVSVDDVLLPGSPFRVRDDEPVFLTTEVPGDGLGHLINVVSEDEENCSAQTTVNVPDCGSDCFLSGLQLNFDGGTTHSVVVGNGGNNTFTPSQITITVGDIVSFDFVDDGHTTTSDATTGTDSWNSGFRGTGTSFPVTIINPGLHRYYCVPHGSPGGSGMAGSIVANCPGGSGFGLTAAFSTTQAGAPGYNLVIDGQVHAGSPYAYSGTGPQSVAFSLPGDGALHTVEIIDLTDGTCTLSRDITAPDCGQAPTCSLFLSAEETGFCRPDDQVNVALSVMAVNAGNSGFNVLLDGNLVTGSPFAYVSDGNTNLDILVPGDGQNHSITITDADDATCSATSSLTTTNCTIPCELTNLTATTGGAGTIHIVDVEDFVFTPRDITIAAGDQVEWRWTGQIAHTATSDAETGPDSWDSGLLNTGATYQSPVLSAGLHNYYCIPHGTPGGNGMAGTITVLPDCTDGEVAVGITFNSTGTGAGYNVFVDGSAIAGGPFSYDASGTTSTSVFVAGDGQSHSIETRDSDDATCSVSTTVTTADCNASTCQLTASIEETTGCDANLNVGATLTVNDVGGSANGFTVTVDGQSAGTFAYSGNGTTTVTLTLPGDGQSHEVIVTDADDANCTATTSIVTTNCTIPCELTNLTASTGGAGTVHIVDVEDFVFTPRDITIAAGDQVEWRWTGQIAHTATSDAETGPDSWDSGLLNTGATYQSPVLSAGLHNYYCIPHGTPGGNGMAGTITVLPDCTNGQVAVGITFNSTGTGASYNVFVDGSAIAGGPFSYDASGTTSTSVFVAGDGQSHSIEVRDSDDATCSVSTTVTTADCNASTCQLTASIEETTGCDANLNVGATLTVNDVGGSANGFTVTVDGQSAGTFAYSGNGTTTVTLTLPGDGQSHEVIVTDADDANCTATTSIVTTNCTIPCELTNLTASTGGAGTVHIVDVEDFVFTPRDITIAAGDQVEWRWTGQIAHTATSDAETGPDSWDSGLLNTGATYQSPVLSAGLHNYYCIPHGTPGGNGMAGTITVLPDCTNGQVAVGITFNSTGTGAGYNVFVDGSAIAGGPFSYDASGTTSTSVFVAGDGQSHSIETRDSDDATCSVSTTVTTADCNASTCQLTASIEETTGCDANLNVGATLTVNDVGGSANGFTVTVDGQSAGTFAYSGNGTTTVTLTLPGDGQSHEVIVTDADDANCTATTSIVTTNCTIPCELTNLTASTGGAGTVHIVDVEDFVFTPRDITIAAGDQVEWRWTGQIAHTATSDAETGPDSWDSGLLNTGATYQSPVLSAGLHNYYCIPHGTPGGNGMAGTITVLPDCTNGQVAVGITFNSTGTGAGYNVFVDGSAIAGGPFSYDASGTTSTSVFVAGDGQSHSIEVRDSDDATCSVSTTVTTADCNASTCQLTASIEETTGCDANLNVGATLTVNDVGGSANGFTVTVDGQSAGTFAYSGNGTTTVTLTLPGDGQSHEVIITDADDANCTATTSIVTTNCTIPCELTNLTASTGGAGTVHIVDVEDFVFTPRDITIAAGDQVEWRWTGQIAHTATSDAETGPDSWDSGLLNTGATYQSPVLSAGLHNYYCIPHGTPGGNGMAGTITVLPDCTDGEVAVGITFNSTGTGAGYNVFVDGSAIAGGPFSYDASGTTSTSVFVAGDGQSHSIEIRDSDDATCSVSTTVTTADCNASTCQLTASIEETTGCDDNLNVGATLTVNDVGGSANGFTVTVDGQSAGTFAYSGNGTTTVTLTLPGDGQSHEVIVTDADDANCTATTSIVTTNCTIPCELTNLTASTGGAGTVHIVDVEDFVFTPRDITIAAGDQVEWRWTGQIAHTATSDAETGPDSWDSGLLNTGATYQSPVLSAGLHNYYCIPHGTPGGNGMAGTITVLPDCTDGEVAVGITFNSTGTGAGYNVFVDGSAIAGGPFSYDASGTTSTSIFVVGDGQSHTIEVRDTDNASCSVSTQIDTDLCPVTDTCQMLLLVAETTGRCTEDNQTQVQLTISNDDPGLNGFNLFVDGVIWPDSPFGYVNGGETLLEILVPAMGQTSTFTVVDIADTTCTVSREVALPNCTGFCTLTDLETITGARRHEVAVRDFDFFPRDLTVTVGDTVTFVWTGQIPHTSTSDEREGPLVWESGLLGQGAVYEVVISEPGLHGYYCIPHGGPNSIGMAGSIMATEDCTDGLVTVPIRFNASMGGVGFRVFLDGEELDSTYTYNDPNGANEITLTLPGDGLERLLTVQDLTTSFCAVTVPFRTKECTVGCSGFTTSFTFTPESGFNVQFDGEAQAATDWLWGFGDGAISREENPLHQYATAGEYRVCLLVQDSLNDCTSNYCETITVGTVATNGPRGRTRLLNVYPNPIDGTLPAWTITGLQGADLGETLPVTLLDISGRILLERSLTGVPELRFAGPDNLPAGMYLLRVQGSSGFYLAKLIVK